MLKIIVYSLLFTINLLTPLHAQLQSERFFDNTGGLLDRVSPLLVSPKNASALSNVTLNSRGQLSKRGGFTALNTGGALGDASNGRYVTGGAYHNAASGTSFFAVVSGTNVYRVSNTFGTSYTAVTGTVTITSNVTNLAQTTSLNDKAIFCNELDKPFYVGSTGNALALASTVFSSATTCASYSNYLILGHTIESNVDYPTRVRWSDLNDINTFPANNYIDVEPNDGDKIVAIITFEDNIYIFKKHCIYQMLITGQSGANAFIVRPLTRGVGAWAKESVKVIPAVGVVFLSQNTVYTLSDSGLEPIGDSIQVTLDNLNRTKWKDAVGEVYPKRYQYWLAMSENSNPPELVLVYDYIQKAWTTYDLNTNVTMMSQAETSTGESILLSGDSNGWHYKQDTGTADYPANTKTVIVSSYTTADLNFSSPEITKNFKYLYIYSNALSSTTVSVETALDFSTLYNNPIQVDFGNTGAVYDTAIYDTDMYVSQQTGITRVELNLTGKVIKFRFSNDDMDAALGIIGWVVVYDVENFND